MKRVLVELLADDAEYLAAVVKWVTPDECVNYCPSESAQLLTHKRILEALSVPKVTTDYFSGWDYSGMPVPGPKVCTDAEGGKDSDRRDEGVAMDGTDLLDPEAAAIVDKNRAKWSAGGGLNSLVAEIDKAVIEGFSEAARRESPFLKFLMSAEVQNKAEARKVRNAFLERLKDAIPGLLDASFHGVPEDSTLNVLIPVTYEELDPAAVPDEADELEAAFVAECPGAIITPAVEIEEKAILGEEFHYPRVSESVEEILGPSPATTAAGELVELPEGGFSTGYKLSMDGTAGGARVFVGDVAEDEGDVPGMALVEMSAESEGNEDQFVAGMRAMVEESREAEFKPRPEEPVIKVEEPVVPSGAPTCYALPLPSIFEAMKVIHRRESKAAVAEKLKKPEWFVTVLKGFFTGIGANIHPKESELFEVWVKRAKDCLDAAHPRAFRIDVRADGCTVSCSPEPLAPMPPSTVHKIRKGSEG